MNLVSNLTFEIVLFFFPLFFLFFFILESVEQTALCLSMVEACIGVNGSWKYFLSTKVIPLNKTGNYIVCVYLSGML